MAIPQTINDCELLLNDYSTMNTAYPTFGQIASDDYYLTVQNWNAISVIDERNVYIWNDEPPILATQWMNAYKVNFQANLVLETLSKLPDDGSGRKDRLAAEAYFFKAFAVHQLIDVFTVPYDEGTASHELGVPIRNATDLNEKSVRPTLEESYRHVEQCYQQAVSGLPVNNSSPGRPTLAAGYAGLARLYMNMDDFEKAAAYADSALSLKADLIDFNELPVSASLPFKRFNEEVVFAASTPSSSALGQSYAKIDTQLYQSYAEEDLRKVAFFRANTGANAGTFAFKGSYDNSNVGIFVGLTVPELYLIRAEASLRTGNREQALSDINRLLAARWKSGTFRPITYADNNLLLRTILAERRKELVFKGRRWPDLKRLNRDPQTATVLTRSLDGTSYQLSPGSLKYAILIPEIVIQESYVIQNKR